MGYSVSGSNVTGRIWHWDEQTGTYAEGESLGDNLQVWSINDFDEMAAFDVVNNEVVGWLAVWSGWTPLNPLEGGDATAALGLNQVGSPTTVVGLSTELVPQEPDTWAVAWIGSVNPTKIDPNRLDETDTPFIINDNDWIVGARGSGNPYTYLLWRPNGQGGWNGVESLGVTGGNQKAVGLNQHNEVIAKKTLFYADALGALKSVALTSISGIPIGTEVGEYNSTNMAFFAVNDDGWIVGQAGRFIDSQQTQVQTVLLLVPFDRNNDETPDYREIIADPNLDLDEDWVLDWATEMRVGLHAPGHPDDDSTGEIANVQVVRHRIGLKQRNGVGLGEGDLVYIDQIIQSGPQCTPCLTFTDLMNQWGTGSHNPTAPKQSETIVWVRSLLEESITDWGDHDALPPDSTIRQQSLDDLRDFAYRFAHCIDYLQWGNEVFQGAGEYKFRNSDLSSCTIADGTRFRDLPTNACKVEAIDKVLEWIEAQMQAAREGAALAGRPMRMIGPGMLAKNVRNGYVAGNDPDPPSHASYIAWVIIDKTTQLCNRQDMYLSMHVHYDTVAQADESIAKLVGGGSWTSPPWDVPELKVATEWGPQADFPQQGHTGDTWWSAGSPDANVVIYQRFFFGSTDPGESWDSFVGRWEGDSESFGDESQQFPGFRFDDVLNWFDAAGFTAVCYGPSLQHSPGNDPNIPDAFNIAGLRANKVRPELNPPTFTTLRTRYQDAVSNGGLVITPFEPHEEACPTSVTCPGCGQ